MARQIYDFDAFREELTKQVEPPMVKVRDELVPLAHSVPLAAVALWERFILAASTGEQIADEEVFAVWKLIYGEVAFSRLVQKGLTAAELTAMVGYAFQVYGLVPKPPTEETPGPKA